MYRVQHVWLGSASISFQTLLTIGGKIDGYLPLNQTPLFFSGYKFLNFFFSKYWIYRFDNLCPILKLLLTIDPNPPISREVIYDLITSSEEQMPLNETDPNVHSICSF